MPRRLALFTLLALAAPPALSLPIVLPDKPALDQRIKDFPAQLATVPAAVIAAFVAQEDRFFWDRAGAGKDSTLTAMSVRLLTEGTPTSWAQASPLEKDNAVEALTLQATPEQILTIYLNLVSFGTDVNGLTDAARTYLNKAPKDLSPAEAAWLAAVAGSPSIALIPANQARTKSQRDYILRQMEKAGALTSEALTDQLAQPMPDLPD